MSGGRTYDDIAEDLGEKRALKFKKTKVLFEEKDMGDAYYTVRYDTNKVTPDNLQVIRDAVLSMEPIEESGQAFSNLKRVKLMYKRLDQEESNAFALTNAEINALQFVSSQMPVPNDSKIYDAKKKRLDTVGNLLDLGVTPFYKTHFAYSQMPGLYARLSNVDYKKKTT